MASRPAAIARLPPRRRHRRDLEAPRATPLSLRVTCYSRERRRRTHLFAGDRLRASLEPTEDRRERLIDAAYELTATAAARDGVLTVRFVGKGGARTASLVDVRRVELEAAAASARPNAAPFLT